MLASPAIETLQRHTNLLLMPLFSAAVYSSVGLVFAEFLPATDSAFYWLMYALMFVVQVVIVSATVQGVDLITYYLSPYFQKTRQSIGLICLTIGLIPLSGIGEGEVGNLLWPISFLTFGFHMFNQEDRMLGVG